MHGNSTTIQSLLLYLTLSLVQSHRCWIEEVCGAIGVITEEEGHLCRYFPRITDGEFLHVLWVLPFFVAFSVLTGVQWSKYVEVV